jgi:hypothetical protein
MKAEMVEEATPRELERRRLRVGALVAILLAGVIAGLAFAFWPQGKHPAPLAADEIVSVDFDLRATAGGQDPFAVQLHKPEQWAQLVAVLNSGREIPDSIALDSGHLTFHLRDGGKRDYGLLSGPSLEYYQFRAYDHLGHKVYRVPRAALRDAVKPLGVGRLDEPNF